MTPTPNDQRGRRPVGWSEVTVLGIVAAFVLGLAALVLVCTGRF